MRITPFRVLEEHARTEYAKKYASVPGPRVINARALATLDAPRSFVWGGVGYWCPPLSFENGSHLLIAANALRDLREGGAVTSLRAATIKAVRTLRSCLRSRRPLWRLTRAFYSDSPEAIERLIRWLLDVEDEASYVPSDSRQTIDLVDNLYTFEGYYKRRPRSWRDYVYGMRHIGRATSRADLRGALTARVGVNADKETWQTFEREMRAMGGWPSHG